MTPASIRNRNPGAMYPGPSAKKFGSTSYETLRSKDGVHKIATFPTSVHGAAAQFDLLNRDYTGKTLEKAIEKWCGNYYSAIYLKVLKDRAGVEPDTVLTKAMLADHEIAIPIAKAMAWQEAGCDYPLKDEEWREAHQMAFGGETVAPSWNPRNDVPTPKRETRLAPMWTKIKAAFAALSTGGLLYNMDALPLVPPPPPQLKQSFMHLGQWSEAVPYQQWQMLGLGAVVFLGVAVAMNLIGRAR